MADKYKIGERFFSSKDKCYQFVKEEISKYGEGVYEKGCNLYNLLECILDNHIDKSRKIGCGIDKFVVSPNECGSGYMTSIKRIDGSLESFSWGDCSKSKYKTNNEKITASLRYSIIDQILDFKNKNKLKWNICGTNSNDDEYHVDHDNPSFSLLKNNFLKKYIKLPNHFDKDKKTKQDKFTNNDGGFENDWKNYHKNNANLQILCKRCNMTKRRKDIL